MHFWMKLDGVMNESTGIREKDGQQLSLNYTYWTDLSLAQDMALAIKTQLAEVGIGRNHYRARIR